MEKKLSKSKHLRHRLRHHFRRKYKHYAAAMAGAAIMTGTVLPGLPVTKAFAAETPVKAAPVTKKIVEKARNENRNGPPGQGWHEHNDSWPSSDENQGWYKDGRIYYRSDNIRDHTRYIDYLSSPVNFVMNNAALYGFDPYKDSYRLLYLSSRKALVEVTKHDTGKLFNVLLERTYNNDWKVIETRAI